MRAHTGVGHRPNVPIGDARADRGRRPIPRHTNGQRDRPEGSAARRSTTLASAADPLLTVGDGGQNVRAMGAYDCRSSRPCPRGSSPRRAFAPHQGWSPTKPMNDHRCAGAQVMDAEVGLSGIRPIVPSSSWVNDPLCCTAVSSWTGIAIYPNEMVPLQIDLAIGMGQYLAAVSANHASLRLRSDVFATPGRRRSWRPYLLPEGTRLPDAEASAMRTSPSWHGFVTPRQLAVRPPRLCRAGVHPSPFRGVRGRVRSVVAVAEQLLREGSRQTSSRTFRRPTSMPGQQELSR